VTWERHLYLLQDDCHLVVVLVHTFVRRQFWELWKRKEVLYTERYATRYGEAWVRIDDGQPADLELARQLSDFWREFKRR